MFKRSILRQGIPIATSLQSTLDAEGVISKNPQHRRIIYVSGYAIMIGFAVCFIAKFLVALINLVTNLSFYGRYGLSATSPWNNHLGVWVIILPAIGGLVIGIMAYFGSKAIRGHGIPEAMEQILTNDSKIKPTITYLKPLSSAIAIGTGGPFGAEGPIIATGGALGSTIGQTLRISHHERKILLAAGATAGMSAIFGSPIAAIFLAVELLLFEFAPQSIIPVALACITGAAGHHFLFEPGPVFPITHEISTVSNQALFLYSLLGLIVGIISVGVTKAVYYLEDIFEELPVHWMWWPAIGGLFVGGIGYIAPRTLGVGYSNITDVLSGSMALKAMILLCSLKFLSWAISLASGTSGGTLAPLLTIGSAAGAVTGMFMQSLFPNAGIELSLAALVGMSAMFAGASRALLTSIIFSVETTGQVNGLLPLLAACTVAYITSLYLMKNTIMTEKIARRGIRTPDAYKPDILEQFNVEHVINKNGFVINGESNIGEVRELLKEKKDLMANYFVIVDNKGKSIGIISTSTLLNEQIEDIKQVSSLVKRKSYSVKMEDTLKRAVELMANEQIDILPVTNEHSVVTGILNYRDIIGVYKISMNQHVAGHAIISLKRQTLRLLLKGQRLITIGK